MISRALRAQDDGAIDLRVIGSLRVGGHAPARHPVTVDRMTCTVTTTTANGELLGEIASVSLAGSAPLAVPPAGVARATEATVRAERVDWTLARQLYAAWQQQHGNSTGFRLGIAA